MKRNCEVWLYGSRARGNADQSSDTDLLVVADSEALVADAIVGLDFPKINVSFYSWTEIARMQAYGSLYLRHIAEEGIQLRCFGATRLERVLVDLPRFTRARQDLTGFQRALTEGKEALADGGWPDFECEVIATVARHAAILGSYCLGRPAFGRERPFHVSGEALGYDNTEIERLVEPATNWRFHRPGPHEAPAEMANWLIRVERFLADLKEVIDDYERVLPITA